MFFGGKNRRLTSASDRGNTETAEGAAFLLCFHNHPTGGEEDSRKFILEAMRQRFVEKARKRF